MDLILSDLIFLPFLIAAEKSGFQTAGCRAHKDRTLDCGSSGVVSSGF